MASEPLQPMKVCRFEKGKIRPGLVGNGHVADLSVAGIDSLSQLFELEDPAGWLRRVEEQTLTRYPLEAVRLLAPVDRQEVWAAGVTYLRSKQARMEESEFSANAYDLVYEAERPELFFKSLPEKVSGPGGSIGIRKDSKWNVPEPELVLMLNSRAQVVGYSVGNDMSSRDIEGQNLLYLPQAKIYDRSCAMGPFVTMGVSENEVRSWSIEVAIKRGNNDVFNGRTSIAQIKRSFAELVQYLFRSQSFPHGAALLTGTGVVPGEDFTLQPRDLVTISISGIGTLENSVLEV